MPWPSKDWNDYRDDVDRGPWHSRPGAPITISFAWGGLGVVVGLIIGWCTSLPNAATAVICGVAFVLAFDFYWRFVRDSLPRRGSRDGHS